MVLDPATVNTNPTPDATPIAVPSPQNPMGQGAAPSAVQPPSPASTPGQAAPSAPANVVAPPSQDANAQPAPQQNPAVRSYPGGPAFQVDPQGNLVQVQEDRPKGFKPILGAILTAALQGLSSGITAGPVPPGASGASAGSAKAQADREAKITEAKQQAQQSFVNRNAADEQKLRHNLLVVQTARDTQQLQFDRDTHPSRVRALELGNDLAEQQLAAGHQAMASTYLTEIKTLADLGVDTSVVVPADDAEGLRQHIPGAINTQTTPLPSGETGANAGVVMVPTLDLQRPLPKPVIVRKFDGTINTKTGEPNYVEQAISPGDINPATKKPFTIQDYVAAQAGATAAHTRALGLIHDNMEKQNAESKRGLEGAQAANQRSEAAEHLANANAVSGEVLKDVASKLVEGTMDPTQMTKRSKQYDATIKAADDYSIAHYGKPFDMAQAQIDYGFAKNPATQNTLKYLNSLTGEDNKSGNLGTVVNLSNGISRTQFPPLNDIEAWGKLKSGNKEMAQYQTAVTEVADQVAKILQGGGSGNGTSDAKLKQASELFDKGFNKQQILGVATTLRDLLGNRKSEMIGQNRYLLRQFGQSSAQSSSVGGQNSAPKTSDPFFVSR